MIDYLKCKNYNYKINQKKKRGHEKDLNYRSKGASQAHILVPRHTAS